jgi:lipopolysaccharide cholinephosphotransferase
MRNTSTIEWELARTNKFKLCYTSINTDKLILLQNKLTEILIDFDDFCNRNNLDYVIMAGTLIGAVRHDGFIPWDDDIDVVVMRKDYNQIKSLLAKDKMSSKYEFILPESGKAPSTCAKFISKTMTLGGILGEGFSNSKKIYIDVLPVDYVPQNRINKFIVGTIVDLLVMSYTSQRCYKKYSPHLSEMTKVSKELRNNMVMRKIIAFPTAILGLHKSMRLINYILENSCKNSKYITIACGVKKYFGEILEVDDLFPSKNIRFAQYTVKGPNNPEKYLTNRYGDYMKIPDEVEQKERLIRLRDDWERFIL